MAGEHDQNVATLNALRESSIATASQRIVEQTDKQAADRINAQALRLAELERQRGLEAAAEALKTKTTPGSVKYVDCRTFGHSWVSVEANSNPTIGWYMVARCERCGTVRKDIVNRFGIVERRRYEYPDSYKDTDHWTRSDWRMQFLRRLQ